MNLFFMTIERLQQRLAGLPKNTKIRLHGDGRTDQTIHSIYQGEDGYIEIDFGEPGPNQTGDQKMGGAKSEIAHTEIAQRQRDADLELFAQWSKDVELPFGRSLKAYHTFAVDYPEYVRTCPLAAPQASSSGATSGRERPLPAGAASVQSAASHTERKPWQIEGEELLPKAVQHAIDKQLMHFGEIPDRTSPDDFPEGYVLTREEIVQGMLNVLEAAVKAAASVRSSAELANARQALVEQAREIAELRVEAKRARPGIEAALGVPSSAASAHEHGSWEEFTEATAVVQNVVNTKNNGDAVGYVLAYRKLVRERAEAELSAQSAIQAIPTVRFTEEMLAAYKGAIKQYINTVPPEERAKRWKQDGRGWKIPEAEKAEARWRAMVVAARRIAAADSRTEPK